MFPSKKFVSSGGIQAEKDEAAVERLKKLKNLQSQYDVPKNLSFGPALKKASSVVPAKKEPNDSSESELDEEELMNLKPPSSSEEESDGEWGEREVKTSNVVPISASLLPEDKELSSLISGSSKVKEKREHKPSEFRKAMTQIGLLKLPNDRSQLKQLEEPGSHVRELNPYWKGGGNGVPEEEAQAKKKEDKQASAPATDPKWLKRALLRCQQLAEDEGRDLEEVVAERYGSLAELQKQIDDAERKTSYSTRGDEREEDRRGSVKTKFMDPTKERDDGRRRDDRRDHGHRSSPDRHRRRGDSPDRRRRRSPEKEQTIGPQPKPREREYKKKSADAIREQLSFPTSRPQHRRSSPTSSRESERKTRIAEREEDGEEPKPASKTVSDNKSAAAALRAQLFGTTAAASLSKSADKPSSSETSKDIDEVVLRTSKQGLTMPFVASSSAEGAAGTRKKLETHSSSGQRLRYLPGEDDTSVAEMLVMEKAMDAQQQNSLYMKFTGKEKLNDDFDLDDAYVEKAAKRKNMEKHEAAEKKRAIESHRQTSKALASCTCCLEKVVKHLVVQFGDKAYLAVPGEISLVPDQCQIIPCDHVKSATLLEDDAWEEVQLFKKSVYKMFHDLGQDVVFMETCMPSKTLGHTIIECFPLDEEQGELAPIYFKKALLDSEGLWSDNKKVIDLKGGNIRKTIPAGFAYFAVEFGIGGQGFAHIIEDERKFPAYFGKEVIGGMVDAEPNLWRRPGKDNIESQLDKASRLQKLYAKYNWTKSSMQVDEGDA